MNEKLVQATVASLGYLENGVYFPEPDCLGKYLLNIQLFFYF
jgi:hypothetical protein